MSKISGTAGQVLLNEILPEDLRNYDRQLTKKELSRLLSRLAQEHPDRYRDVSFRLMQLAKHEAYYSGGFSVGLKHLKKSPAAKQIQEDLQTRIDALLNSDEPTESINEKVIQWTQEAKAAQDEVILEEALAEKNPLAYQVIGSGKGKAGNISSLRGFDGLYEDHRDRIIPVPVLNSYSEGLDPMSYWASTYGGRKGVVDVKLGVANSGYLSKQLSQIAHKQLVSALDRETPSKTVIGYPVETNDTGNIGSLLSQPIAGYERNTVLTRRILDDIQSKGHDEILVRSSILTGPPKGGVYAYDAGLREGGRLPLVGENISTEAAQAVGERLAQGSLSSKHSGGVAGAGITGGFNTVNKLFQVPKIFQGGATHASVDGVVRGTEPAPAGGQYILIGDEKHYVGPGIGLKVKRGDLVEAGDVLSDGLPNPAELVQHKGVGEGRRYFVDILKEAMKASGVNTDRRNLELLARGAINHVKLEQEYGPYTYDDVVPYDMVEHSYEPREGMQTLSPKKAVNQYLERPYLHYTIGTRVTPRVAERLQKFGIEEIDVHGDEPIFSSAMVPAARNLQKDPDWMVQMYGSGLKANLLKGTHTGAVSDQDNVSFVPAASVGVNFGKVGPVRYPGEGYKREQDIPKNPNLDLHLTDRKQEPDLFGESLDDIFGPDS